MQHYFANFFSTLVCVDYRSQMSVFIPFLCIVSSQASPFPGFWWIGWLQLWDFGILCVSVCAEIAWTTAAVWMTITTSFSRWLTGMKYSFSAQAAAAVAVAITATPEKNSCSAIYLSSHTFSLPVTHSRCCCRCRSSTVGGGGETFLLVVQLFLPLLTCVFWCDIINLLPNLFRYVFSHLDRF